MVIAAALACAAPAGASPPVAPSAADAPLSPGVSNASERIGQVTGRTVTFEAPEVTPQTVVLVSHAADLTARAFEQSYRARAGRAMNLVKRVVVQEGRPRVEVQGSELLIFFSPDRGVSGLPTVEEISRSLATPTIRLFSPGGDPAPREPSIGARFNPEA